MIDSIDAKILKALQRDGRLSQLELADEIGLVTDTLHAPCENWRPMDIFVATRP